MPGRGYRLRDRKMVFRGDLQWGNLWPEGTRAREYTLVPSGPLARHIWQRREKATGLEPSAGTMQLRIGRCLSFKVS